MEREEDEGGIVGETFIDYVSAFFFLELAIRAVVLVFSLHWTCLLIFLKLFENKNLFHAYVFNCSCSDLQNCLLDPLIQILLSRRLPYLQYNRLNPLMN